ncbi:chromate efflux transporter [Paenibacillus sp. FJAT-26967]|uniref:chromate efflux transporter n=1 Tax=Paenibacillus sp. FJAT-26967 TaxID=1729690 RepID=UPI000A00AA41|nr:chromate efflux transporter [Paenibacillus sp. FJAT-26967]
MKDNTGIHSIAPQPEKQSEQSTVPGAEAGGTRERWQRIREIAAVSTRLGLTSFGGPVAHLGYFHEEYVRRRKWLDSDTYTDLVALCQFLPGPASSQVGIGIGIYRAGLLGGLAAWLCFTLPSALALVLFAYFLEGSGLAGAGWVHGLKVTAVAVVAHAVLGMGQKLASDRILAAAAVAAMAAALLWPAALTQIMIIAVSGGAGYFLYRKDQAEQRTTSPMLVGRRAAVASLIAFGVLLAGLPLLRFATGADWIAAADTFYRAGALVFGGGHVVLPLLESEFAASGWISHENFLAGYGAAQAVPGPLFTFASYLGAMWNGAGGALLATIAIFLPAFLLVAGVLPFWSSLRTNPNMYGALQVVHAAVVGILLAALYDPLWTSAIVGTSEFIVAVCLFVMLAHWKLPPWLVVAAGILSGAAFF